MNAQNISLPQAPTDGIHGWLMDAAWSCRKAGMSACEAVKAICSQDGTLRRRLQPKEAQHAVEKAYSAKFDPSIKFEKKPELPIWNERETSWIHTANPITVSDLSASSPIASPASCTPDEILSRLFSNPDGLLCVGASMSSFITAPRQDHKALHQKQLIVPAYMTAKMGMKADGTGMSQHAKANTGPRRFIVCDFDSPPPEQHPAIIMHLAKFRPLTMALSSGGKSLHAWFPTTESADDDRLFWRLCIGLGADPAIYRNPSQFVRMPNGTRDNGKPQAVAFLNLNNIPQP